MSNEKLLAFKRLLKNELLVVCSAEIGKPFIEWQSRDFKRKFAIFDGESILSGLMDLQETKECMTFFFLYLILMKLFTSPFKKTFL